MQRVLTGRCGTLAQAYAVVGQIFAEGRGVIELAGTLRFTAHRLQDDLDRLTLTVRPTIEEEAGVGYFEILDGSVTTDTTFSSDGSTNMFGDLDDVLAFTARRDESPFIGEFNFTAYESPLAEIVWWIQNDDGSASRDEPFTIYRRVLLILPDLRGHVDWQSGVLEQFTVGPAPRNSGFELGYTWLRQRLIGNFHNTDLSIRPDWYFRIDPANGNNLYMEVSIRANSLTDLTDRKNRFRHWKIPRNRQEDETALQAGAPYGFPFRLETTTGQFPLYAARKLGEHFGQDVMLTNALGFDVQIFDPDAVVRNVQEDGLDEALTPSDPGYSLYPLPLSTDRALRPGRGAFVDLGYGDRHGPALAPHAPFFGIPQLTSQLGTYYTYCTWSNRYELFTSRDPVFDYYGARFGETPGAPYPRAAQGVRVHIRAWEPDFRQVRQMTVTSSFVRQ